MLSAFLIVFFFSFPDLPGESMSQQWRPKDTKVSLMEVIQRTDGRRSPAQWSTAAVQRIQV